MISVNEYRLDVTAGLGNVPLIGEFITVFS
jgi:hypothetical protein